MFSDLPKALRQEIHNFLYLELVNKVPLFADTDHAFRESLALSIRPYTLLANCYVFRAGEEGDEMYFIRSGAVDIVSPDGTKVFVNLTEGKFFGEIALVENSRRSASARTAALTELCVLQKKDFELILRSYPAVKRKIEKIVAERKEADRIRALEAAEKERKAKEENERLERERKEKKEKQGKDKTDRLSSIVDIGKSFVQGLGSQLLSAKSSIASFKRLVFPCYARLSYELTPSRSTDGPFDTSRRSSIQASRNMLSVLSESPGAPTSRPGTLQRRSSMVNYQPKQGTLRRVSADAAAMGTSPNHVSTLGRRR